MKVNDSPIVSVAIIAYNVEKYIGEAIESVLMQECSYPIQIVVGEDCSTDNTRDILLDYQKNYPEVMKILLHEKNLGLTPNSWATQNACDGKYIALLDGDDYWTDKSKLQKQIDFLEKNPKYAGSAHQSLKYYEDIEGKNELFGAEQDFDITLNDTLQHRKFHTSSLVYRKEIWDQTGGIPKNIHANERALYPLVALFGKIKYFKDSMCIYRLNSGGVSSRLTYKIIEEDENMIPFFKRINQEFKFNFPVRRFKSFIHFAIYAYPSKVPMYPLLKHYFKFVWNSFSYFPKNLGDVKHGTKELFKKLR